MDWRGETLGAGIEAHKRATNYKTELGSFLVISPLDLIIDRLQAFEHWNDRASGEWANCLIYMLKNGYLPGNIDDLDKLIEKSDLSPDILRKLDDYLCQKNQKVRIEMEDDEDDDGDKQRLM